MLRSPEKLLLTKLGQAVRDQRHELRLSQEELAERADLHRTYVADIERGTRNLGFVNLVRVAEALELPVESLVAGITLKRQRPKSKK